MGWFMIKTDNESKLRVKIGIEKGEPEAEEVGLMGSSTGCCIFFLFFFAVGFDCPPEHGNQPISS